MVYHFVPSNSFTTTRYSKFHNQSWSLINLLSFRKNAIGTWHKKDFEVQLFSFKTPWAIFQARGRLFWQRNQNIFATPGRDILRARKNKVLNMGLYQTNLEIKKGRKHRIQLLFVPLQKHQPTQARGRPKAGQRPTRQNDVEQEGNFFLLICA